MSDHDIYITSVLHYSNSLESCQSVTSILHLNFTTLILLDFDTRGLSLQLQEDFNLPCQYFDDKIRSMNHYELQNLTKRDQHLSGMYNLLLLFLKDDYEWGDKEITR